MTPLSARIEGIGFWASGLPSWNAARAFVANGTIDDNAPTRPSAQLLAPNERRRAPGSVAVALQVALDACQAAARDPAQLPSIFASTHGDLAITDYMCATLAESPANISPTRFHNSVHNAAAGYWTIGAGCMQAATAISAYRATFAQGLLEAMAQLAGGSDAVLLAAYDASSAGPLAAVSPSTGLLGGALVLRRDAQASAPHADAARMTIALADGSASPGSALTQHAAGNAMMPMLPLFDALATGKDGVVLLDAGPDRVLRVEIVRD